MFLTLSRTINTLFKKAYVRLIAVSLLFALAAIIFSETANAQACNPPPTCSENQASRWNGTSWECVTISGSSAGGLFTTGSDGNDSACRYPNPQTGSCSCPSGTSASQLWEYTSSGETYADGNPDAITQVHSVKIYQCN